MDGTPGIELTVSSFRKTVIVLEGDWNAIAAQCLSTGSSNGPQKRPTCWPMPQTRDGFSGVTDS
jgi:hypothetical protein